MVKKATKRKGEYIFITECQCNSSKYSIIAIVREDRVKSKGFMITDHPSSTTIKMARRHALMSSELSDVYLRIFSKPATL